MKSKAPRGIILGQHTCKLRVQSNEFTDTRAGDAGLHGRHLSLVPSSNMVAPCSATLDPKP